MPTFGAWQLSDLHLSGPDPFGSSALANPDAVGATRITIRPDASQSLVTLAEEGAAETEYSYLIRPVGSADPADNRTIHVLEYDAAVQGIAASDRLLAGQSYQIVGVASDDPVLAYTGMAVCIAAGTLIATRRGPKPVEDLAAGDRLQTCDNGYAPVRWVGRWRVNGMGASAPVRFAPGVLGNDRALELSGQHRVLIRPERGPLAGEEVLVAAKTLVGLPGISRMPRPRMDWVHVLLPTHEVIFAENMRTETLLAEAQAVALVEPSQGQVLRDILAADPFAGLPARPIVPPEKVARLILPSLPKKPGALRAIA